MSMNNTLMINLNVNALSLDSALVGGDSSGQMLAAVSGEEGDDDT
jgi:hypothetical protein